MVFINVKESDIVMFYMAEEKMPQTLLEYKLQER
jgi:hypothetical protein